LSPKPNSLKSFTTWLGINPESFGPFGGVSPFRTKIPFNPRSKASQID